MNYKYVVVDFEFRPLEGGQLLPLCLAWEDAESEGRGGMWLHPAPPQRPPFPVRNVILVGHSISSAESLMWLQLGWKEPAGWIDTLVESRVGDGGHRRLSREHSLLHCCRRHGVETMSSGEQDDMRDLILSGSEKIDPLDQHKILRYCAEDVRCTVELFHKIRYGN